MTSRLYGRYGLLSVSEVLKLSQTSGLLKQPVGRAYDVADEINECPGCDYGTAEFPLLAVDNGHERGREPGGKIQVEIDGKSCFITCPLLNPECGYGQELLKRLDSYSLNAVTSLYGLPLRFHQALGNPINTTAVRGINVWGNLPAQKCFLILHGEHGTGKSFGAAYALYVLAHRKNFKNWNKPHVWSGLSAMWASAYRVTAKEELFEKALTMPILVIDDLGSEGDMPRVKDKLNEIVSERYNHMLLTIMTMNGDWLELEKMYGRRLFDRVLSAGDSLHCGGENLRLTP